MNNTKGDLINFFHHFLPVYLENKPKGEVVFLPPYLLLYITKEILIDTPIRWGAQNFFYETKGAYTGEISANMLKDAGCTHVLIGHSERRIYFKENQTSIARKLTRAFAENLIPIVCVGETMLDRKQNKTHAILTKQLKPIINSYYEYREKEVVIAYEPIWAIGTGNNASSEEINDAHSYILNLFSGYSWVDQKKLSIIYGGSVDKNNASKIVSLDKVNGCLVGSASLKPEVFMDIINSRINQ